MGAEFDSGRRGQTDVERRWERFGKIIWEFRGSATPAEISPGNNMIHAIGPIPRGTDIPFHVSIESEHFAIRIESNVEGIAKSAGK